MAVRPPSHCLHIQLSLLSLTSASSQLRAGGIDTDHTIADSDLLDDPPG